jgi:hypothetical protein
MRSPSLPISIRHRHMSSPARRIPRSASMRARATARCSSSALNGAARGRV